LLLIEKNLAAILQRVNESKPVIENVNKLSVQSQQMMGDVRQSLHKVDKQLDQIPGLLNNGQSVLKNTESVLNTSEQTIKGVQKIWPLSSALKPPATELLIEERGLNE
jgi:ABC-type transporter Mla subunit MlaD